MGAAGGGSGWRARLKSWLEVRGIAPRQSLEEERGIQE